MSLAGLFNLPEQAGYLEKHGHSRHSWQERYFVLKGSSLFYFKDRKAPHRAAKVQGFIPLEGAKIETELPPNMAGKAGPQGSQHCITITLHSSFAFSCAHPFYVLRAPSKEVQSAWVNACWQAAIPRADLIATLSSAGKLADVLASYAKNVQANFPVADAAVLSTGGRARNAGAANVGTLAGEIRRHGAIPSHMTDVSALPVVASDKAAPTSVLARTTSGNIVAAPSAAPSETDSPQHVASTSPLSTAGSGGTPFRTKPPSPRGTDTSTSKLGGGGVTLTAVAGGAAGGAAAPTARPASGTGAARSSAADAKKADNLKRVKEMKEIEEQIARLEKEANATAA